MPDWGWRHGRYRHIALVVTVLCLGSVWSVYRFIVARDWEAGKFQSEFALASENRVHAIRREVDSNLNALNALRGLAEIPHAFDRTNFDSFAARLLESHPSLRALEWVARVPDAERARFEKELRQEGVPYPEIADGKLGAKHRAAQRKEYYPVRYLYPHNAANGSALGYDLGFAPDWRAALKAATDTGRPSTTAKFKLLEHTGDGYAVAAMLAVYQRGASLPAAGAPQPEVIGYAMLLVQVSDLLERALENLDRQEIDIQFYDRSAPAGKRLLHFHPARQGDRTAAPLSEAAAMSPASNRYTRTLMVGGREWLIVCTPTSAMVQSGQTWRPWVILAVGMFITLVVAAYCLLDNLHRARLNRLVLELTGANQRLNQEIAVRTQAESDLAVARDAALDASRLKSQFLAMMSHEIRTPMNGVIGMTGLLLETPLTREQREYAQTVRHSGEALLTVINDILDLSRIEAGRIRLEREVFDLRKIIANIASLLGAEAVRKGLVLNVDYPSVMPSQMAGDAGRVRQVLTNLVGNAIKFTSSGEVAVTVTREADASDPARARLRIAVRDTGPGIAPEDLTLLFTRFSQVDSSTTREHGGTGLGLAISRELVTLMGGEIGVDSVTGQGSTFWFTLPIATTGMPEEPPAPLLESTTTTGMFAESNLRVLVAEDNIVNQKVALRMLEKLGLRCDVAGNGRIAVEMFAKRPYDLIFMDCHMPEMDGYEATGEIRKLQTGGQHPAIIAMTAEAMIGSRENCLAAGMDDYVSKPVRVAELLEAVRKWIPALADPAEPRV